jgi:hypothetical protein
LLGSRNDSAIRARRPSGLPCMINNPERVPAQSARRRKLPLILSSSFLSFHSKQVEFYELHHHRNGLSRGIVSQKGIGCGGHKKGRRTYGGMGAWTFALRTQTAASTVTRISTNSVRLRGRNAPNTGNVPPSENSSAGDHRSGGHSRPCSSGSERIGQVQSTALEFGIDRNQRGMRRVGNAVG